MSKMDDTFLSNERAKTVLDNIIQTGRAGLFFWDIEKNQFDFSEKISGRNLQYLSNLQEFIQRLVYEKDQEMALQDLDDFFEKKQTTYQSTFRILDTNENVRWVFCKGTLMPGNILSGIIYNVSPDNFIQGHDLITNLINRETFMRKLNHVIQAAEQSNQTGALLYIEIENFHNIINKYGFDFGGSVLYQISRILLKFVGDRDELARFPYDKFMVLLTDIESSGEIEQISQEISEAFNQPVNIEDLEVYLKINMGITLFPNLSTDALELVRYSDFALSYSRQQGNNDAVFFDANLLESYNRDMNIETELPKAIMNQELSLVFQPQLGLKTRKITGFEALVRWNNEHLGFISPGEFIPIAEEKGYIVTIGRWILKEAIRNTRRWLDKEINFKRISINISAVEITQKDFVPFLLHTCKIFEVSPQLIELEITERTLMTANEDNRNITGMLQNAGFKLALDDFGIGYSNFNSLLNFEMNTLKLDKSLIDNIRNRRQLKVVKTLIDSKNLLYSNITAEGVEDEETLQILTELGCDTIQGYYFSKALPPCEIEEFVKNYYQAKK